MRFLKLVLKAVGFEEVKEVRYVQALPQHLLTSSDGKTKFIHLSVPVEGFSAEFRAVFSEPSSAGTDQQILETLTNKANLALNRGWMYFTGKGKRKLDRSRFGSSNSLFIFAK